MKLEKDSPIDFYQRVYDVVRQIPYGKVTTYGLIARHLGSPQAARMVGWAMNQSHSQENYVPAHRVVNRNGMLSGKHHFNGEHVMEDLLMSEEIAVKNDCVVNFEKHLWNPGKCLE